MPREPLSGLVRVHVGNGRQQTTAIVIESANAALPLNRRRRLLQPVHRPTSSVITRLDRPPLATGRTRRANIGGGAQDTSLDTCCASRDASKRRIRHFSELAEHIASLGTGLVARSMDPHSASPIRVVVRATCC